MHFYYHNGRPAGPLAAEEFLARLRSNEIHAETLVCTDQMDDWMTLEEFMRSGALPAPPPWQEELRKLAMSDKPLSKLPKAMGTLREKAQAYGRFLEETYRADRPAEMCTVYRNVPARKRAVFTWEGSFPNEAKSKDAMMSWAIHLLGPIGALFVLTQTNKSTPKVSFQTAHDFSQRGAEAFKQHRFFAPALELLGWIMVFVAGYSLLMVLVGALALGADARPWPEVQSQVHAMIAFGFGAGAAAIMSWGAWRWARAWRLPAALRNLEKKPLRVKRIQWTPLA